MFRLVEEQFGSLAFLVQTKRREAAIKCIQEYSLTHSLFVRAESDCILEFGYSTLVYPMISVAFWNSIEMVDLLLQYGFRLDYPYKKRVTSSGDDELLPLQIASKNGYLDLVECFVRRHGVDVNSRCGKALPAIHQAISAGHLTVVKYLVEHGASFVDDLNKTSALHAAVSRDVQVDIFNYLLTQDVDVNYKDKSGSTPLHTAVQHKNELCLVPLLDAGADVNAYDKSNFTPFALASRNGCLTMMKILYSCGADPEMMCGLLKTVAPLDMAVNRKQLDVLRYLAADLNLVSTCPRKSEIALDAARRANFSVLQILLEADYSCIYGMGQLDTSRMPETLVSLYEDLMYNPRSLRTICRCSVRAALGRRLLDGVSSLPLPPKLIDFVK